MKKHWDNAGVVDALAKMHRQGKDLSYNRLAKAQPSLLAAAIYHFGSYRRAVEEAHIGYEDVARRPRWTKAIIIKMIKEARERDEELHWSAVMRRKDELKKAAFAALQERLFGSWENALRGAGLNPAKVHRYRKWSRDEIVARLQERSRRHQGLNSGTVQREDSGLLVAAIRHFGSYNEALSAAGVDPADVRLRRRWSREDVLRELRSFQGQDGDGPIEEGDLRSKSPALHGAVMRFFPNLQAALKSL